MDTDLTAQSHGDLEGAAAVPRGSTRMDADLGFDMPPIGSSDTACKECRRRKARCNKALPTCDLCVRYRRHCLYEKHSRTPLTRKYLTEVEERLERAEDLIRQMRSVIPSSLGPVQHQNSSVSAQQEESDPSFNFSTAPECTVNRNTGEDTLGISELQRHELAHTSPSNHSNDTANDVYGDGIGNRTQDDDQQRLLESPPLYDFAWCEKETGHIQGLSPEAAVEGRDEDTPISDGMASLTVNEHEGGYLGVASGAAMLRLLESRTPRRTLSRSHPVAAPFYHHLPSQPNPNRHIVETMIDSYFRLYHVSYPIIHEPTFRAQYSEVISRPDGSCWTVLAYVVAAIGVWASSNTSSNTLDLALFAQARSMLNFDFLEVGNLTLVQALTLTSNYQQKRDKPNSGYNYLGLAVRMAMGLGLHKEFQGWNISPLNMEVRRRVWWSLCVFDIGATITFSRPDVWPYKGVEVSLPLNVNDKDLTAASQTYPPESNHITPYTAVATQARFHIAAHECYDKIISRPFPTANELIHLDTTHIEPWQESVPAFFANKSVVPPRYALSHAVMSWRLCNLRIIMYRPFVIRRALRRRADSDEASSKAYDRCLSDAKSTIQTISDYWSRHEHNRLAAWYALYFLFQAALIPCICLRNDPGAVEAGDWRAQIISTLHTIANMSSVNTSSERCHQIILNLCGRYLDYRRTEQPGLKSTANESMGDLVNLPIGTHFESWIETQPVGESPQTQIHNVISMMWPNVPLMEAADVVMDDEAGWMEFIGNGAADVWDTPRS
ncbi:Fc.00g033220.m01.CDS01 [Cosmosporella sp. VM-42]